MPCTRIFDAQEAAYRERVLGRGLPRVAVEAGVSDYWRKYVGLDGAIIGIDTYGESAPGSDVFKYFDFTAEHVASAVKSVI
jgi:transketolase